MKEKITGKGKISKKIGSLGIFNKADQGNKRRDVIYIQDEKRHHYQSYRYEKGQKGNTVNSVC